MPIHQAGSEPTALPIVIPFARGMVVGIVTVSRWLDSTQMQVFFGVRKAIPVARTFGRPSVYSFGVSSILGDDLE